MDIIKSRTKPMQEEDYENFKYQPTMCLEILLATEFNRLEVDGTKICHVPEMTIYEPYGVRPKYTFPDPESLRGWIAIEVDTCPKEAIKFIRKRLETTRRFTLIRFYTMSTFCMDSTCKYLQWLKDKDDTSLDMLDLENLEAHMSTFLVDKQKRIITWIDSLHSPWIQMKYYIKTKDIFHNLYPYYKHDVCAMTYELSQEMISMEDYCVPFSFFVAKDLMLQKLEGESTKRVKQEPLGERIKRQVFDILKPCGYNWANILTSVPDVDFFATEELLKELGNPSSLRTALSLGSLPIVTPELRKSDDPFPTFTKGGVYGSKGNYASVFQGMI